MKNIFLILFLIITTISSSQNIKNRKKSQLIYANEELNAALNEKNRPNGIDNKTIIIKDSITALNIAEPILFGVYGKKKIIEQKPYQIIFTENHWIINGTLPEGYKGGTFLIIIDARNCKIVKLIHGK